MDRMKHSKRHKIKSEMPETSTVKEEHDLAYYIHDRVELMHQVFSVIKAKEFKMMAPECVRNISIDDLQELCMEELLGISSKRLCAILDGADPPTDTESSSSEQLETISLDSISSDDEILSQHSRKSKKHKHKKHRSKKQHKKKDTAPQEENAASRAGLTVLELLELQARARAIRAQLQQHNLVSTEQPDPTDERTEKNDSSDEVEIKEEPAEVVEISSEDEKPNIEDLPVKPPSSSKEDETVKSVNSTEKASTVTKRINDLIITVPQAKTTRKIKLNRPKTATVTSCTVTAPMKENVETIVTSKKVTNESGIETENKNKKIVETKTKAKKEKKYKKRLKNNEKEGSDHDEITLQLSDSEKMDLLDFDRKNYDNLTTSGSEDTESSSDSDSNDSENSSQENKTTNEEIKEKDSIDATQSTKHTNSVNDNNTSAQNIVMSDKEHTDYIDNKEKFEKDDIEASAQLEQDNDTKSVYIKDDENIEKDDKIQSTSCSRSSKQDNVAEVLSETFVNDVDETKSNAAEVLSDTIANNVDVIKSSAEIDLDVEMVAKANDSHKTEKSLESNIIVEDKSTKTNITVEDKSPANSLPTIQNSLDQVEDGEIIHDEEKKISDGEIPEKLSEVVYISDEENKNKKKRKKEKKSKKDKKNKKSKSDFREDGDQNFYIESGNDINKLVQSNNITEDVRVVIDKDEIVVNENNIVDVEKNEVDVIHDDDSVHNVVLSDSNTADDDKVTIDDDIYEILELSDDSSCYEVEGVSMLSKIPTKMEIEALSAKIDEEIHFDTGKNTDLTENNEDVENISWRDRYLDSKKVKKVLTTANILNALRKKNKELKRKLEETKTVEEIPVKSSNNDIEVSTNIVEGSIDQFNTLEGSTKYVDPVKEINEEKSEEVTKELEIDAKRLLKMYKRLLKHNDMYKQKEKDPTKKKKKKQKKNKEKKSEKL